MRSIKSMQWYQNELKKLSVESISFGDSKPLPMSETMPEITGMAENDAYLYELMLNDHIEETINDYGKI